MFEEINSKCDSCAFTKSSTCKQTIKNSSAIVKTKGRRSNDILFLFEMPESQEVIDKFEKFLYNNNVANYTLANSIGCQTEDFSFPGSLMSSYEYCGIIKEIKLENYKTIVPIGRALISVTQTDDIPTWEEFVEFLFNDTFFYTPYELNKRTGKMIRIYPLPPIVSFIGRDNFNNFFAEKQLKFIKEFLKSDTIERFDIPDLYMVEDTDDFFDKTKHIHKIAWDTETNSLNHFQEDFKIGCVTISFDGKSGYYLPFEKINRRKLTSYFRDRYHIGANLKYDNKAMRRMGVNSSTYDEDVILLFHVLNTVKTRVGLKTIAWQIGFGGYDEALEAYKKKHKVTNYLEIPEPLLFDYATLDAIVTYRAYEYLKRVAQRQPAQYKMYKDILMPAIPVFEKAELYGLDIDKDYLNKLYDYLVEQKEHAKLDLWQEAGKEFDPESNEEIAKIFEELGLPCLGRTKKDLYQTGQQKIDDWVKHGYTIAKKLMNYRKASKMISAFGGKWETDDSHLEQEDLEDDNIFNEKYPEESDKEDLTTIGIAKHIRYDGRVHPDYKFGEQYTFRSADPQPGLTRMPKKGKEGKIYRPVFKPDPDFYFGEIDYAGLQLRITAGFSGDPVMNEIFTTGHGDMHSASAQAIFLKHMTIEEVIKRKNDSDIKPYRNKAKAEINFALIFSDGYYVLLVPIKNNWSDDEIDLHFANMPDENKILDKDGNPKVLHSVANDVYVTFMTTYPYVEPYIHSCHEDAMKKGYAEYIADGKRHLPWLFYVGTPLTWKQYCYAYGVDDNKLTDTEREYHQKVYRKIKQAEISRIGNLKNISVNTKAQSSEALLMYRAMVKLDNLIVENKLKSKIIGMVHDAIVTMDHKDELDIMVRLKLEAMNDYHTFSVPLLAEIDNGPVWGFGAELDPSWSRKKMLDTIEASYKKFVESHDLLKVE